jgi:hypothetical protein
MAIIPGNNKYKSVEKRDTILEDLEKFSQIPIDPPTTIKTIMDFPENRIVELNVGGSIFTTTLWSINNRVPESVLAEIINHNTGVKDSSGRIFIDRDPKAFPVILQYLRTGKLYIPRDIPINQFLDDCLFYGIDDHLKKSLGDEMPSNTAEEFQQITYLSALSTTGWSKNWSVIRKHIIQQLNYEPTNSAEIEWVPVNPIIGARHNIVIIPLKVQYDKTYWCKSYSYIRIELGWDELKGKNFCVEHWCRFLRELGFTIVSIDGNKLRFTWEKINF